MGVLFGFFVGWAVGARGGRKGFDDVVAAAKEVLRSEEVATLQTAVRLHAEYTLRQLADWLQETREAGTTTDDVLTRVRRLVQPDSLDDD
jgi:hypothetical protein